MATLLSTHMDHASHEELAKSYLRLRFDTAGAQRGKRKEKVGRGVSTRQTSSQNLGNVTAIESGKGPKLVFSAPLMVVPTHEQRTIGPAGTETALLDPNRVHHEYCRLRRELERRFAQCKLRLHPDKTRIVYCKDGKRRGRHPLTSFDFLGYTFRARKSRSRRGAYFTGFNPAISRKAQKAIRQAIRGWQLQIRTGSTLEELSRLVNSTARGWAHYYGAFHRSVLHPVLQQIDKKLTWWAVRKYKRFRGSPHSARKWLRPVRARFPGLFAHWQFCHATVA